MAKIILDLCGGTGAWSKPYRDVGYEVHNITLPEYNVLTYRLPPPLRIHGILAAPPCTEFSVLNCAAEARDRDPAEGLKVVLACLRIIAEARPAWWALENPVGYLRQYLGKGRMTFQPWEYGDPWSKRTEIWGCFEPPKKLYKRWEDVPDKLPLYTRRGRDKPNFAYLHRSAISAIPQLSGFYPESDAAFRAITPPGFARAFFEANP